MQGRIRKGRQGIKAGMRSPRGNNTNSPRHFPAPLTRPRNDATPSCSPPRTHTTYSHSFALHESILRTESPVGRSPESHPGAPLSRNPARSRRSRQKARAQPSGSALVFRLLFRLPLPAEKIKLIESVPLHLEGGRQEAGALQQQGPDRLPATPDTLRAERVPAPRLIVRLHRRHLPPEPGRWRPAGAPLPPVPARYRPRCAAAAWCDRREDRSRGP